MRRALRLEETVGSARTGFEVPEGTAIPRPPHRYVCGRRDIPAGAPARRGDQVVISSRITRTGKSSITVETIAAVEVPTTGMRNETIRCHVTFVCLLNNRPYPYFETQQYQDHLTRSGLRQP